MKEVGEILQRIYDSEIHLRLGWLWDGGLEYSIGCSSFDLFDEYNKAEVVYHGATDLRKGINEMAQDVADQYPESDFAKWWEDKCAT